MRYLFILLIASQAIAGTDWLCTEEASQRKGDSIYACGIGIGQDERVARDAAFDSAKAEFKKVCGASDDCKMHRITVSPERTTCERDAKGIKCYRLIVFSIGEAVALKDGARARPTKERPDSFESFEYSEIASLPKVRIGMTKAELLKGFGEPKGIGQVWMPNKGFWGTHATLLVFSGKMCADEYACSAEANCEGGACGSHTGMDRACFVRGTCGVALDGDEVIHVVNFRLNYTEDLK